MPDTELVTTETPRSEIVRLQILQVGSQLHRSFIVLGHLLKEARDNDYHNSYGYARFGEWIESDSSGLDMSERSAYDFIKVIEGAERLRLTDDALGTFQYSSLKEILSLPADTDPAYQLQLLEESKTMKAKDVKSLVGTLKNEAYTYHTIKNSQEVEDNVYQPALERVRREYGDTVGADGGPEDITDSKCIEMLCADKLSGPEEEDDSEIIEGEFVDITERSSEETASYHIAPIGVQEAV